MKKHLNLSLGTSNSNMELIVFKTFIEVIHTVFVVLKLNEAFKNILTVHPVKLSTTRSLLFFR